MITLLYLNPLPKKDFVLLPLKIINPSPKLIDPRSINLSLILSILFHLTSTTANNLSKDNFQEIISPNINTNTDSQKHTMHIDIFNSYSIIILYIRLFE